MKFPRKDKGRIYTNTVDNIEKIKEIIKEIDEFEYKYLPENLIAVYEGKIEHVHTHKFDELDLNELMKRCWDKNIYLFCTF